MSSVDLSAAARRHPRVLDTLIAALMAGACALILTAVTPARPLDWASLVVVATPLVWRRRAPALVFWAVVLLYWSSLAVGAKSPAGVLLPLTALHALARYRPPAWSLPAVCFVIPAGLTGREPGWASALALIAVTVTVLVVGISQRFRDDPLAALSR